MDLPLLQLLWANPQALQHLLDCPPHLRRAYERCLDKIREHPRQKPLKGRMQGLYAIKVTPSYRIVYTYDESAVVVYGIGNHKQVYR
ncbi:hypothetical protein CDAR_302091 [Caerostris darwini]|uniref:Type II toxin-antitoxin system RelE/ParE family toxin n=1 Tax=Caerostris darwini TaxID=1538125 RepID=A0AAV4SIA1_9ARAC|nr:hypothetical protein CDAR_302091 [Caerostris darwini]